MMRSLLVAAAVGLVAGCGVDESEGADLQSGVAAISDRVQTCEISCIPPPPNCVYRGAVLSGPCAAVTCGQVICEPHQCPLICAPPPPGCHYEGMITFPCHRQTCGQLVCDS